MAIFDFCIFGLYGAVSVFKNYTYFTLPCRGLGLVGLALYMVSFSARHCWLGHPLKIVPDMTYNVFGETLNPTLLLLTASRR